MDIQTKIKNIIWSTPSCRYSIDAGSSIQQGKLQNNEFYFKLICDQRTKKQTIEFIQKKQKSTPYLGMIQIPGDPALYLFDGTSTNIKQAIAELKAVKIAEQLLEINKQKLEIMQNYKTALEELAASGYKKSENIPQVG